MKKILLPILLALVSTVSTGLAFVNAKIETTGQEITYGLPPYEGMKDYKAKDVEEYIDKVWTYYSNNYYTDQWNWVEATYYLGVLEAYKSTANKKYYNQAYTYAEGFSWKCNS